MQRGDKSAFAMVVLLVASLLVVWSTPSQAAETKEPVCPETPLLQVAAATDGGMSSTGETAPPSGDVQERAVPRMGPGGMAPNMPGKIEGAILEKGRVRVQPGYVLQQQADGSVMAKRAGGGSGGSSFSCFCALGKGGCKMIVQGGSAWCSKSADNPCSNTCDMKISKFSDGGMIMQ